MVPVSLTSLVKHQLGSSVAFWAVEGVLRTAIFLGYLLLLSRIRDLRRVFQYHGAEHKVISCYEADDELVPERAKLYSRLHPRCGTSFLLVVMIVAIFVFAPIGLPAWWLLVLTRIVGVPVIAGLSFELIKWAGRNRRRRWVQVIMYPGLQLQRLTTSEPDLEQLAVAIAALKAVLAVEGTAQAGRRGPGRARSRGLGPIALPAVDSERGLRVVIVGAGFGGIGAAIELRRHGFEDVVILERAPRLGGTWLYNTYPGCTCDVPSHLYSFSFAQRRDWSRLCSPQEEILEYLEGVARDHGVDRLVVPDTDVKSCDWDDQARRWTITSADGRSWEADAVIVATGQLHQPAMPSLEGRDEFAGHSFHSAALGPRLRPARQARRGDRDRRERDPVHSNGRRAGRRGCTSSSEPATGSWRETTAPIPAGSRTLIERVPGAAGAAAGATSTTTRSRSR